jgi:hypothetical protein
MMAQISSLPMSNSRPDLSTAMIFPDDASFYVFVVTVIVVGIAGLVQPFFALLRVRSRRKLRRTALET